MQIVVALPAIEEMKRLEAPVCGVPLLTRVIATAVRAGGTSVLLLVPPGWPLAWLRKQVHSAAIEFVEVKAKPLGHLFDPSDRRDWAAIAHRLEHRFLWLPYDYVPHKAALLQLLATAEESPTLPARFAAAPGSIFDTPAVLVKSLLAGEMVEFEEVETGDRPGISARPPAVRKDVEAELVRRSGKVTDGIYSSFNRMLCRPAVRWFSHTPITPNMVSFGGLAIALLAGLCFAGGTWMWNIAGGVLFFLCGLFDEIDGMLARLRFQESAFGCWLETMADYASYLLIFSGMAIGGYRHGGWWYLPVGLALLSGSVLSFFVISIQRKLAAPADRPNEYARLYLKALDGDSGNIISRSVRLLGFLTKKGVLVHYVLLFALFGALPAVFFLSAVGANITWMVTIYFNRRLFSTSRRRGADLKLLAVAAAEVKK